MLFRSCPKPKKLDPKQKVLSNNIQKFLEKKKEEERRKLEEEKWKKEKLLKLRSQDKKATKRVGQMLRMTKSANKSVLEEAKDSLQDALVEQGGLILMMKILHSIYFTFCFYRYFYIDGYQPDEDDYGYVSQHAAEYHKKMLEKYRALPKNKPVSTKTPEGVPIPKSQSLKTSNPSSAEAPRSSGVVENCKSKPKPKRAEPVNFDTLIKLAEVNSKDPPKAPVPKPRVREEENFEFGRPMTAKEKAEYLYEKEVRRKIEQGVFNPASTPKPVVPIKNTSKSKTAAATPGLSSSSRHSVMSAKGPSSNTSKGESFKGSNKQAVAVTQIPQKGSSSVTAKMNGIASKKPVAGPSSSLTNFHAPPSVNASAKITKQPEREVRNPVPEVDRKSVV